ncbi:hypothetical protein [Williamsia sp.]|uniref:hypothetical protein n=1 Tax=Williamsia sp. TaxID=1872085 RepID=UPI002F95621E
MPSIRTGTGLVQVHGTEDGSSVRLRRLKHFIDLPVPVALAVADLIVDVAERKAA